LSREKRIFAGAEVVGEAEGNMNGAVMRGAVALPWSKTPSRAKGSRWNLGDLMSGRAARGRAGPLREGEEPSPGMDGHEKSDPLIVAVKPATAAGRPAGERVERRGGAKGNAGWQSTRRAQDRS
jgi:hypothetical protein